MTDAASECARPALSLPVSPAPRAVSDIHTRTCSVAENWALVMSKQAKKQAAASEAGRHGPAATTASAPDIRAPGAPRNSPPLARGPVAADKQQATAASATEDAFQWPVVGSERPGRPERPEATKNDRDVACSGAREALRSPCDCAHMRFSS
jgi:hypothetical protein